MSEAKQSDLTELLFVDCVGVDNRQHVCEPHKEKTKCGIKIKRKKLLRDDWMLFNCYECTY